MSYTNNWGSGGCGSGKTSDGGWAGKGYQGAAGAIQLWAISTKSVATTPKLKLKNYTSYNIIHIPVTDTNFIQGETFGTLYPTGGCGHWLFNPITNLTNSNNTCFPLSLNSYKEGFRYILSPFKSDSAGPYWSAPDPRISTSMTDFRGCHLFDTNLYKTGSSYNYSFYASPNSVTSDALIPNGMSELLQSQALAYAREGTVNIDFDGYIIGVMSGSGGAGAGADTASGGALWWSHGDAHGGAGGGAAGTALFVLDVSPGMTLTYNIPGYGGSGGSDGTDVNNNGSGGATATLKLHAGFLDVVEIYAYGGGGGQGSGTGGSGGGAGYLVRGWNSQGQEIQQGYIYNNPYNDYLLSFMAVTGGSGAGQNSAGGTASKGAAQNKAVTYSDSTNYFTGIYQNGSKNLYWYNPWFNIGTVAPAGTVEHNNTPRGGGGGSSMCQRGKYAPS